MRSIVRYFNLWASNLIDQAYPRISFLYHIRIIFAIVTIFLGLIFTLTLTTVNFNRVKELRNYQPPIPSVLFDRKGRIITTFFVDQRILINKEKIPPHLIQAFVAMEDNHFFDHYGLDIQAIARAFLINLQAGEVIQGGSTITQQLAKLILTNQRRTFTRKAKEALLSLYLDAIFEKKDILHLYFNQIYFGHGNYGVEAASKFYFKKSASEINIGEAAILASLPSAPNRYSPVKNPHLSLNRMQLVLLKMIDRGFLSLISAQKVYSNILDYYRKLNESPTSTAFGIRTDKAPYFSETIRQKLKKQFGKTKLYQGGLKIYTGLDLDHQKAAQNVLWEALKKQTINSRNFFFQKQLALSIAYKDVLDLISLTFNLKKLENQKTYDQYELGFYFQNKLLDSIEIINLGIGGEKSIDRYLTSARKSDPFLNQYFKVQGAFIEVDHKTGDVTAMVGGSPFSSTNQLNRTWQMKRQSGSTIKALLYASAIESKKVTAATVFPDSPLVFLDTEGETWMPNNYSNSYRGFIRLRDALKYSTNMVSIRVAREVGLSNILSNLAYQLQVPPLAIPTNYSVALGSYETSPLQLTTAFASIPRGGLQLEYVLIRKVEDQDGNILWEHNPNPNLKQQLYSSETAEIMNSILKMSVDSGTGTSIRSRAGYSGFAAGKTGTTDNYRDAWFIGYNKRYTAGVWLGYDRPTLSLGTGQSGGNIAAPIWGEYQNKIADKISDEDSWLKWGGAVSINICTTTGKLPSSDCPKTTTELFLPGTEPKESERISEKIFIDAEKSNNDFFEEDDGL